MTAMSVSKIQQQYTILKLTLLVNMSQSDRCGLLVGANEELTRVLSNFRRKKLHLTNHHVDKTKAV